MANTLKIINFNDSDFYKKTLKNIRDDGFSIVRGLINDKELKELDMISEIGIRNADDLSKEYINGKLLSIQISNQIITNNIYQIIKNRIKKLIKYDLINPKRRRKNEIRNLLIQNNGIKKLDNLISKLKYNVFHSDFNEKNIYITMDNFDTMHSAQKPHFDWRTVLKGMIYLDNCDKSDNGGLFYIPRSHVINHDLIFDKRLKKENPGKTDSEYYFENSIFNLDSFEYGGSLRGDILLFNTDGFHYQGQNTNKNFNRIIRFHSYINELRK